MSASARWLPRKPAPPVMRAFTGLVAPTPPPPRGVREQGLHRGGEDALAHLGAEAEVLDGSVAGEIAHASILACILAEDDPRGAESGDLVDGHPTRPYHHVRLEHELRDVAARLVDERDPPGEAGGERFELAPEREGGA